MCGARPTDYQCGLDFFIVAVTMGGICNPKMYALTGNYRFSRGDDGIDCRLNLNAWSSSIENWVMKSSKFQRTHV